MLLFNDYKSAKNWLNHLVSYLLLIAVISIPKFCSVLDFCVMIGTCWYILLLVKIVNELFMRKMINPTPRLYICCADVANEIENG